MADLRPYLTDEELAEYVPGYLEEGAFSGEGTLKIFPIAKSVELLMLNADGLGKIRRWPRRG